MIGVDAVVDNLRVQARKLSAKPARGGLANALLGRMALADAPGALEGLADHLTALLPWGALLGAVAQPDVGALAALRGSAGKAPMSGSCSGTDPRRTERW